MNEEMTKLTDKDYDNDDLHDCEDSIIRLSYDDTLGPVTSSIEEHIDQLIKVTQTLSNVILDNVEYVKFPLKEHVDMPEYRISMATISAKDYIGNAIEALKKANSALATARTINMLNNKVKYHINQS